MSDQECPCETPEPTTHGFWTGSSYRIGQRCSACGGEISTTADTIEGAADEAATEGAAADGGSPPAADGSGASDETGQSAPDVEVAPRRRGRARLAD